VYEAYRGMKRNRKMSEVRVLYILVGIERHSTLARDRFLLAFRDMCVSIPVLNACIYILQFTYCGFACVSLLHQGSIYCFTSIYPVFNIISWSVACLSTLEDPVK